MKFESLTHANHYAKGLNIDIVVYKDKVIDVTEFKLKHPGGEGSLDKFFGKDCTEAFDKTKNHLVKAAKNDIKTYTIGTIFTDKNNKIVEEEQETKHALDIKQGLLWQILRDGISKKDYLEFIHDPKHMINPPHAILFEAPYLEVFSKTPWYMIPIIYAPFALYYFYLSLKMFNIVTCLMVFFFGVFLWTFSEYILHRFVFHFDDNLPDNRIALFFHFLLHGIHHAFPMDR